jgi:hypothetical protein
MAIFNPKLLTELAIDALDYAIGVEVGQIGRDRKYRPISFFLKKFLGAELNYKIYDKELLAIVRAIKENHYYLKEAKCHEYMNRDWESQLNCLYYDDIKLKKEEGS